MNRSSSDSHPLVRVATAANELLVRMWAEALESQGIPCLVKLVGALGISGVWSGPVFEHELLVRASQTAEAAVVNVKCDPQVESRFGRRFLA